MRSMTGVGGTLFLLAFLCFPYLPPDALLDAKDELIYQQGCWNKTQSGPEGGWRVLSWDLLEGCA